MKRPEFIQRLLLGLFSGALLAHGTAKATTHKWKYPRPRDALTSWGTIKGRPRSIFSAGAVVSRALSCQQLLTPLRTLQP